MFSIYQVFALIVTVVLVGLLFGLGAAWIVFRSSRPTVPGERLFGRQPKGEVFSVPDLDQAQAFPGAGEPTRDEETMLKNTERFLGILGGKGGGKG